MSTEFYGYTLPCACSESYQFTGPVCKTPGIKSAVLEFSSNSEIPANGVLPYSFKPVDTIGVTLNPNGSFSLPVGVYFISYSITAQMTTAGVLSTSIQSLYPGSTIYTTQNSALVNTDETLTASTIIKVCKCSNTSTNPSYFQVVNTSYQPGTNAEATAGLPSGATYAPMIPVTPSGLSTSSLTIIKLQ